jgi:hypothetical protein
MAVLFHPMNHLNKTSPRMMVIETLMRMTIEKQGSDPAQQRCPSFLCAVGTATPWEERERADQLISAENWVRRPSTS